MNFIQHTRAAHEQLTRQPDATPFHVSLYWALFFEWNANRFPESLALDHEHLMSTAHIGNRKTYRATLYDLETWGLLTYQPSQSRHQPSRCFLADLLGAELPPVNRPTEGTCALDKTEPTAGTSAPGNYPSPGAEVAPVDFLSGAEVPQPLLIGDKRSTKSKPPVVVNGTAAASQKKIEEASPVNEGLSGLVEDSADDCQPAPGAAPKKKVAPKKKGVQADAIRAAATAASTGHGRGEPRQRGPLPEVPFCESAIYPLPAFVAAFAGTDYALADLPHYHQLVDTWRDKKTGLPPTRRDWLATARRFMLNDAADNRLKLAPNVQHFDGASPDQPNPRGSASSYRSSRYD